MRTISVSISDFEYNKFEIKNDKLTFSEFVSIINKNKAKQALNRSIKLSNDYKFSEMSVDEINEEIAFVRDAKNNN